MQGVISIASGGVTASTCALYLSRSAAGSTRRADALVLKSSLFGSKDLAGSPRKSVKVDDGEARKGKAFQVRAATNPLGVFDKVENLIKGIVYKPHDKHDTVTYKGIAKIAKRRAAVSNLVQSDLLDIPAVIADKAAELVRRKINIQLVSVDPHSGGKEETFKLSPVSNVEGWITNLGDLDFVSDEDDYSITFKVPKNFGEIGAFVIKNNHPCEFFLKDLRLQGPDGDIISFKTLAWIHPEGKYKKDRVFFTSKTYLPSETPAGLVALRKQELEQTRGDGTGERKPWDRIYDYDVYNDIGKPDDKPDGKFVRPVLGGSNEFRYPRRMRTGRPMSKKDPNSESRLKSEIEVPYIPSDEFFLRTKNSTFIAGALKGFSHSILPSIDGTTKGGKPFKNLEEIRNLYRNGLPISVSESTLSSDLTAEQDSKEGNLVYFSQMFAAKGDNKSVINYPTPQVFKQDEDAWKNDQEYGRQALAGLNPAVIQRVEKYPPESTLDPKQYGEGTSLTDEHILPYLGGQTVAQAIESKKLFTIDYHDAVLPFLNRANDGTTPFKSYAPRTFFFLNEGQMKPIAIELSKPPTGRGGKASNRVFTPADDHLWTLAKIHASCIDSSYHQVVSHFTNTHATVEPFIIASNRQLSDLHPIKSLLQPHFKDTLAINAGAREVLIAAGGVIESNFSFGRYAMELGSKAYGAFWQFDTMGLPGDLLHRGMAEPTEEKTPGSVKLVVEDYPYAKDGLEIWDALYEWAEEYCRITYYEKDEAVKTDKEIQAWWNEIVNVGHGDHKDAKWWPKLDSIKSLAHIVTSIAWIAGPFHASVNFGQYSYSGYPLNKTTATRKFIPEKNSPDYTELQKDPTKYFLSTISNSKEATTVMTVLELLATHSVDEEYIGTNSMSTDWTAHPKIAAAFRKFSERIASIGDEIKERNKNTSLINRSGPAKVPYTLLYPTSTTGLTGKGVPYSISI